jgi:uncharacterized integral membrane protein
LITRVAACSFAAGWQALPKVISKLLTVLHLLIHIALSKEEIKLWVFGIENHFPFIILVLGHGL